MRKFERSILQAGYEAELEYLSTVDEREYLKNYGPVEELKFKDDQKEEARQAVRNTQKRIDNVGPSEPETEFADDLFIKVAEELKLEDYFKLKFYTAVNSHLDKDFGEDAFFDLDIGDNKTITVSLDLKTNLEEGKKADITINVPSPEHYLITRKENSKEYWEIIIEAAKKITKQFKNQIN